MGDTGSSQVGQLNTFCPMLLSHPLWFPADQPQVQLPLCFAGTKVSFSLGPPQHSSQQFATLVSYLKIPSDLSLSTFMLFLSLFYTMKMIVNNPG